VLAAAAVLLELARQDIFRADYPSMRDWAARALDAAKAAGDRALTALSAALLALAHGFLGEVDGAEAAGAEVIAALEAMGDDELATRLDAEIHLASAEFYVDRLEAASAHAEHAFTLARATGHGDLILTAFGIVGNIRLARGDLRGAREFYDAGVETSRLTDTAQMIAWNLVNRSLVASAAGDTQAALAASDEVAEMDALSGTALAWSGMAHAEALLAGGDSARAEAELLRAAGEDLAALPGGARVRGLELLTRCRLVSGGDAQAPARAARSLAAASGLPVAGALAGLAEAAVTLAAGDAAAAAEQALSAAALADGAGARLEAARARALAGRALAVAGDAEAAAEQLDAAAAQLDDCGAPRSRDAVERELRKLGRRRHRRTRGGSGESGLASLTERELQVARLIVDRRTNPEIAAELFLSTKTVESHVRNLFRKLDVSSRADVARVVERADRAPAPG